MYKRKTQRVRWCAVSLGRSLHQAYDSRGYDVYTVFLCAEGWLKRHSRYSVDVAVFKPQNISDEVSGIYLQVQLLRRSALSCFKKSLTRGDAALGA